MVCSVLPRGEVEALATSGSLPVRGRVGFGHGSSACTANSQGAGRPCSPTTGQQRGARTCAAPSWPQRSVASASPSALRPEVRGRSAACPSASGAGRGWSWPCSSSAEGRARPKVSARLQAAVSGCRAVARAGAGRGCAAAQGTPEGRAELAALGGQVPLYTPEEAISGACAGRARSADCPAWGFHALGPFGELPGCCPPARPLKGWPAPPLDHRAAWLPRGPAAAKLGPPGCRRRVRRCGRPAGRLIGPSAGPGRLTFARQLVLGRLAHVRASLACLPAPRGPGLM